MARQTPIIRAGVLILEPSSGDARTEVPPESDAWFRWLESARTFAFEDASGHFTARKKRRWGADYWYAFRRGSGRLYETYLGKARDLSLGRLHMAAAKLSQLAARTARTRDEAPLDLALWQVAESSRARTLTAIAERQTSADDAPFIRTPAAERLVAIVDCALTIVSAPAGYGKTTALTQAIATARLPTAWVTLDERDNDPVRFWTRVVAAMELSMPGLEATPVSAGVDGHRSAQVMLTALIAALPAVASPALLILDDYHTVNPDNTALHAMVARLAQHLPPRVHLALASRTSPPLPLAALRERHRLLELGAADLRFTLAETRIYLSQRVTPTLSDDDIARLHARAEGWVVALQLAALSLREQSDPHGWITEFTGENHQVFEYLVEEVVKQLPAHLYTFVLHVAPLRQLSGPLCNAVTRASHSQAMLEEMERENLFLVPLDDQHEWYRLHHLFADAAQRYLRRTRPGLEAQLYARASAWCEAHGLALDAMDYAFAASESEAEHTADLVEAYIPSALASGYVALLRDRLERLPDKVLRDRPRLSVAHAYTLYLTGERVVLLRRLHDAEQATERSAQVYDPAELAILRAEILALRATTRTLMGESSPRDLIASFQQAAAALPRDHEFQTFITFYIGINQSMDGNVRAASRTLESLMRASLIHGNGFYIGYAVLYLGLVMLYQERLDAALALCTRVERRLVDESDDALRTRVHLIRGKVLYERGELEPAIEYLLRGLSLRYDSGLILMEAFPTLAHAQLALGDATAAQQTMEQCVALWENSQAEQTALWVWTGRQVRAHQAHLWLAQGDVESALTWARELKRARDMAPTSRAEAPSYLREWEDIVLARLYLAERRAGDALALLETLGNAAEADGRVARLLEILTLQAAALYALDDIAAALRTLQRAVELGWRQRVVRTFVEGGPTIQRLLTILRAALEKNDQHGEDAGQRKKEEALQRYISTLLEAFAPVKRVRRRRAVTQPEADAAERPAPLYTRRLTSREYEVLRLIASGASNDDIARTLVIASSTAKRHVSNIFAALNVHRRTQAVARARELGVLTANGLDESLEELAP